MGNFVDSINCGRCMFLQVLLWVQLGIVERRIFYMYCETAPTAVTTPAIGTVGWETIITSYTTHCIIFSKNDEFLILMMTFSFGIKCKQARTSKISSLRLYYCLHFLSIALCIFDFDYLILRKKISVSRLPIILCNSISAFFALFRYLSSFRIVKWSPWKWIVYFARQMKPVMGGSE